MRHIVISDKKQPLYLLEQEVPKVSPTGKTVEVLSDNVNHFFITDVSGSMYSVLPKLAADISAHVRKLKIGDTLSFAWFSGEGDFRFVLKGFKISEEKDYDKLEKTFRDTLYTRGTTCFSEVLGETETVIKDLAAIANTFALTFFTDGYPVVSNYNREIANIKTAISKIQGKFASSMLVGYGDYYNKELMADMAERLGGSLIHSSDLSTFSTAFTVFLEESRDTTAKVPVKLETDVSDQDIVFGINSKQINLYKPNEKGVVDFSPTKKKRDCLYVLTKKLPAGSKEVKLAETTVRGENSDTESVAKGAYAAAYVLTQKTKVDMALEVLGKLGDVALIDRVTNSYTNAEYGATEAELATAAFSPSKRFAKGRNTDYLPPEDAFCLMDVMQTLMTDQEAFFYPRHENFSYSRIGKESEAKEGYPKFEANKNAKCPLKDLVWNATMLNLSVRAKIDGLVPLNGDPAKVGFSVSYPTYVYRNYTVVKDGFLNVQVLPVSLSETTFKTLQQNNVIPSGLTWQKDAIFTLQLGAVPVINRAMAEGRTSATDLCKSVIEETKIEAEIKVFKFLKESLSETVKLDERTALTAEQTAFLESNGITKSGFSPPTNTKPATDFYMAKEFDIKLKGLSSLPKIADVIALVGKDGKTKPAKALTVSQQIIFNALNLYWASPVQTGTDVEKINWLTNALHNSQFKLAKVRRRIQETKFAVLLGKKWFDEFTSREDNTLKVDEYTCTVSVREVKVDI